MKHIVLEQPIGPNKITLLDLLHIIDSSENIRIFVDDNYIGEINPEYAKDLLTSFHYFPVVSIETMCTKTYGNEPIIHLCIYIERPKEVLDESRQSN